MLPPDASSNPSRTRAVLGQIRLHWRLGVVLWTSLLVCSLPIWIPLSAIASRFDNSPFRESVLEGWDSWAVSSLAASRAAESGNLVLSILLGVFVHAGIYLFLSTGMLRVLHLGLPRPAFARTVIEAIHLAVPTLRAFLWFLLSLFFWWGVLAAIPAWALWKLPGAMAPSDHLLRRAAEAWLLASGAVVFIHGSVRFDLARIALVKERTSGVLAAFRIAGRVMKGGRLRVIGIWLFWFALGGLVQSASIKTGLAMNPSGSVLLFCLILFRQVGFLLLAFLKVGFFAHLLSWEENRFQRARPVPLPAPSFL
jgi:hypothetical protein